MIDGLENANAGHAFPSVGVWRYVCIQTVEPVTPSAMAAVREKMRAERTLPAQTDKTLASIAPKPRDFGINAA
jgi:hypothetical protein